MSEREPNQIRQSSSTLPMRKCGVTNAVKISCIKLAVALRNATGTTSHDRGKFTETNIIRRTRLRHKQLVFMMQPCVKPNVHMRHGYAPFIPKCGILSQQKNVPWLHPSHIAIPTLSDPSS
jgi:hypothetical protein